MIKVLHIISDTNIGGAGRSLLNLLRYYDRSKFSMEVILPKGSLLCQLIKALDTKVIETTGIQDKSLDISAILSIRQIIRAERPDIVHTHGSMTGRIAARREGCKVIYTRHSAFPVSPWLRRGPGHRINGWIGRKYADKIISVSPACTMNLTESGIPADLIETIPNGVEAVPRRSAKETAAARRQFGIADGVFTAGVLARMEEYKGHLYILSAAEILREKGFSFQILIAGEGSFAETVQSEIKDRNLSDVVHYLGFVSDVSAFLSVLDVQLNASYGTEATSLSLLEGFSMGLPAVVSSYGGNPYVVEDNISGLVFQNRNAEDLAEKLEMCITSPSLVNRLGKGAERAYQEKYTGEINANNIQNCYRRVMEDPQ